MTLTPLVYDAPKSVRMKVARTLSAHRRGILIPRHKHPLCYVLDLRFEFPTFK